MCYNPVGVHVSIGLTQVQKYRFFFEKSEAKAPEVMLLSFSARTFMLSRPHDPLLLSTPGRHTVTVHSTFHAYGRARRPDFYFCAAFFLCAAFLLRRIFLACSNYVDDELHDDRMHSRCVCTQADSSEPHFHIKPLGTLCFFCDIIICAAFFLASRI